MSERSFKREVAKRVFAQEYSDSSHHTREENDKYAPQYVLTPTGAMCNRLFVIGTLAESPEDIGIESEYLKARVIDPTGGFYIYAGQYQPDAVQALQACEPPCFISVVGKVVVYEAEDRTLMSIRPEVVQNIDAATRDLWTIDTAHQTLERLKELKERSTENARKAVEIYNTDISVYKEMVETALKTVDLDETGVGFSD